MVVQRTDTVGLAAYRVMFAHSSDGVLFCTQDGRITSANPAACDMLGLPAEQIFSLGRDGLIDQEDPRWGIAVAERQRTGTSVGVARLRRGDGRFVEIELTALDYRGEDGTPQTCCILRDLTGRLAVERELEELSARLLLLSRGDELTGFQNRRGLITSGTQLLQIADRQGAPVHALFVEVGNVQDLNERLGHQAGDAALQAVAACLVGDVPQERRAGTHRRHPVPGAQPPRRRRRLRRRDRSHPRASRRSRDARVRRRRGARPLRLDDPPHW